MLKALVILTPMLKNLLEIPVASLLTNLAGNSSFYTTNPKLPGLQVTETTFRPLLAHPLRIFHSPPTVYRAFLTLFYDKLFTCTSLALEGKLLESSG